MQFVTSRVGGSSFRDGGMGALNRGNREVAGRSLSLYNEVPEEELTLDEFETFALDRLALLRGMENLRTRGYEGKEFNDRLQAVRSTLCHTRRAHTHTHTHTHTHQSTPCVPPPPFHFSPCNSTQLNSIQL